MSSRRTRAVAACLTVGLLATACTRDQETAPSTTATATTPGSPTVTTEPIVVVGDEPLEGRVPQPQIVLTDGAPAPLRGDPIPVVTGDPLDDAGLSELIDRLPEWEVPDDDTTDFERPPDRIDPPVPGDTVETPFPPPAGPPAVEPAELPLEVRRYQPEGEVRTAPFLSVTFNQPMVPLATLDQLAAEDVPVELMPHVPGRWRWIGTRTLRFEVLPDAANPDRLPAATEYTVRIPAGTTSASGAVLADDVEWTFATPAPDVVSVAGVTGSMRLDPIWVATFDQLVDPDAVLATVAVEAGGEPVDVRLATDTEIAGDEVARSAVGAAPAGRAVAFRPAAPLPADTAVEVHIGPDTPSAEGSRTSRGAHVERGRTFGNLRVTSHGCRASDQTCRPGDTLYAEFSNELATSALDRQKVAELVSIEPTIPGVQIRIYGSVIEIYGPAAARTTYTVTFAGELADVHGQTLGDPVEVTFTIDSAMPSLSGFQREFVTLDPMADTPTVSFTSVNHGSVHVTAWGVSPNDIDGFRQYLDEFYREARPADPDWPVVFDAEVEVDADEDVVAETFVDLSDAFAQAGSQVVIRIAPSSSFLANQSDSSESWWRNRPTIAWVQRTTLGIDVFTDGRQLVMWTTDLESGEPVGGVPIELIGDGRVATTDEDGLAVVELGEAQVRGLFANAGERSALAVADWWSGWSAGSVTPDQSRWYVLDDRGIYRPGETVRVAGWVREFAWEDDATLRLVGGDLDDDEQGEHTIEYVLYDGMGAELARSSVPANPLGGFNLAIELPEGANLGQAMLELRITGPGVGENNAHFHYFQIQEFRRPEFEVTARAETPPPYFVAGGATVAVDATYFAGGGLPDAEVQWLISTAPTSYAPPGWDGYRFGVYTPWWWGPALDSGIASDVACWDCPGGDASHEQFAGRTNADGSHYLNIAFGTADDAALDLPRTVTAEATVFDVNRQAWSDRTDLLVHPAEAYVGLRTSRSFVSQGTPIQVEAIVTDVDGAAAAGRAVEVTAARVEWNVRNGVWGEDLVDRQTCAFDSTDQPHECEFATEVGGEYRLTAVVTDAAGQRNRTELTVWVAGGTGRPARGVEQEAITVVPAADEFAPGTTAEVLVQAPFAPASGTYTIAHGPIRESHVFEAPDGSAVLEIPIESADVPNLNVTIEMVGTAPRTNDDGTVAEGAPPRPALATGEISLPVPPIERTLTVTATPAAAALEPGADTTVTVAVAGADGAPVEGADVALIVVDEAVLALTGYQLTDPLGVFYAPIWNQVQATYARGTIVLTRADRVDATEPTAPPMPAPGDGDDDAAADMAGGATEAAANEITSRALGGEAGTPLDPAVIRENFDALAVFEPAATTGSDGSVTVDVALPDSLTRYRVMAVAVAGATNFGTGESSITARLPLMARPSAPRFLNFGDAFELPVVLQNQTDTDLEVLVAVEVANLELTDVAGQRVVVPANNRVEVRFPAATVSAGTARYRVVAATADPAIGFVDAVAGELPVYTPSTAEAFATYGVVDGTGDRVTPAAVGQPVIAPTGVLPQFGGLEITTSSTALSALTDAVLYVAEYPYRSSDSLAGRIISIATLRDVLEAFDAEGLPSPDELDRIVADDVAELVRMRNDDGGWAWFVRGHTSDPWLSVTATHALVLAQAEGYPVPQADLDAALGLLAVIEEHIPPEWGQQARLAVQSYALYVRQAAGAGDPAKAADVYREGGEALQLDAMAWLWSSITDPGIRAEIETTIANRAVDNAGATTFATDYGEDAYLIAYSDRRTDAIVLDALLTETPDSDLVARTVVGLMSGQRNGRWNNLYENTFALVALHRYFETFESVTPDFVARAWLGPEYVAEHAFAGRSPDRSHTVVPMRELIDTAGDFGATPLVLANDGVGRLYYRLGVRYAPADFVLDARDEGFIVDRTYEAVDDPADVSRDEDGTWHIRAGASVRVRLTLVADAVRYHVALVDPLPAGLEAINPALDVSQTVPPDDLGVDTAEAERGWWPWWRWFDHEHLGDDRVEAFATWLGGGVYEYEYVARATTPGEFVVPPATAEQIYAPEVFGRSASTRVVVAD